MVTVSFEIEITGFYLGGVQSIASKTNSYLWVVWSLFEGKERQFWRKSGQRIKDSMSSQFHRWTRTICSTQLLDLHYKHTLGAHVPFISVWLRPLAHKTRALMHVCELESHHARSRTHAFAFWPSLWAGVQTHTYTHLMVHTHSRDWQSCWNL